MHRSLTAARPSRIDRAEGEALLRKGPWAWPYAHQVHAFEQARAFAGGEPPAARPGEALLLAVDAHDTGWVWALSPAAEPLAAGPAANADRVVFGDAAERAWGLAEQLLPRVLPVMWRSVAAASGQGPRARCLAGSPHPHLRHGVTLQPQARLEGPSFGLSFLLGLASAVLGVPLPEDLAATAALRECGRLAGVAGLAHKLRALTEICPRVTRVLVAAENKEEAKRLAGDALRVIGCATIADAFREALPDPTKALERLGDKTAPADQPQHVRAFFRLATGPRAAVPEWTPIAAAADVMLERWSELGPLDRERLDIARQIAHRHASNTGTPFALSAALIAATPQPERTALLAHRAQQAADGEAPRAEVLQLAAELERHLVRGPDAFPAHLGLLGALARIWAVTGRPEDALRAQEDAAQGWLDRNEPAGVSQPLSEMLRLAGALGDAAAFARACETRRRAKVSGAFTAPGSESYVTCAHARALASLEPSDEAVPLLRSAIETTRVPHLVSESCRTLVGCLVELGRHGEADEVERVLAARTNLPGEAGDEARCSLLLVQLDRAVRGTDDATTAHALARFRAAQPGPVGHLESAAAHLGLDLGIDRAAYVARFFPY